MTAKSILVPKDRIFSADEMEAIIAVANDPFCPDVMDLNVVESAANFGIRTAVSVAALGRWSLPKWSCWSGHEHSTPEEARECIDQMIVTATNSARDHLMAALEKGELRVINPGELPALDELLTNATRNKKGELVVPTEGPFEVTGAWDLPHPEQEDDLTATEVEGLEGLPDTAGKAVAAYWEVCDLFKLFEKSAEEDRLMAAVRAIARSG